MIIEIGVLVVAINCIHVHRTKIEIMIKSIPLYPHDTHLSVYIYVYMYLYSSYIPTVFYDPIPDKYVQKPYLH